MRRHVLTMVALALPAALSAQQTILRLAPPQGQVSRYRIEMSTQIDMAMASIEARSFMELTSRVTAAQGEERTVETVVDSFRIDSPSMPMPEMPSLIGSSTTVRMNTRGEVLETTYSDEGLTETFGGVAGAAGQGFPAGIRLPEQPVAVGHQWNDSNTVQTDAGPMGEATVTSRMRYTLERLFTREGARIALVAIQGTMTQAAGAMAADGTMQGSMEFDLDAGRWVTNRMTIEMKMNVGTEATMTITTNARLLP
ncbi:MAG: hypothetical protein WD934_10055 [Gemmatimonadales bacterium]